MTDQIGIPKEKNNKIQKCLLDGTTCYLNYYAFDLLKLNLINIH